MPLSILEAWSAEVPVVATRVGGIPGLIETGRTGLLVDPGDEATLATHLGDLLDDPGLARRLGAAGRLAAVAGYDRNVMAAAYDDEYRALLTSSRPRPGT